MNQDECRLRLIDTLDDETVFITQDFAMKFLPVQYREAQSDFFGKRGISWHISVCLRKNDFTCMLESLTFIHILSSGLQDSCNVVPIMENVLRSVKDQLPKVCSAVYRQDNAGCYHCAFTILSCKSISESSGVVIRRVDFSDPQGGKGICDRKAAQIKTYLKTYVNEGNSIRTASEMKSAIESIGIPGVRVAVVAAPAKQCDDHSKWDGISSLNDFVFTEEGIRAYKAYGIGRGKLYHWSAFSSKCA